MVPNVSVQRRAERGGGKQIGHSGASFATDGLGVSGADRLHAMFVSGLAIESVGNLVKRIGNRPKVFVVTWGR
jgi:hypothetical protein